MSNDLQWPALAVFSTVLAVVAVLGFAASKWKPAGVDSLDEWGLGGRRFGPVIMWFLIGGDFYTATTVIALPALMYSVGGFAFFAMPYTILVFPFVYLVMPRIWSAAHAKGYVTASDLVLGQTGSRTLALAVAVTSIVATMPYIGLQLLGMKAVIGAMGFGQSGWSAEVPLLVAFGILAAYTYSSGLRAPALIAFLKDIMIYIVVVAAVVVIPSRLGGYGAVFEGAKVAFAARGGPGNLLVANNQVLPFITLAIGSLLAAFMYPHAFTGILSASSGNTIRRSAVTLPLYNVLLALIILLGYMALAMGIKVANPNDVVPAIFLNLFPNWFAGFAFAAIAVAALVPAAIMSIGAANLITRNVWRSYVSPTMTPAQETFVAKIASLGVKVGALAFISFLPTVYAIDMQLLGGIWILQVMPAVLLSAFATRLRATPALIGWLSGVTAGTWMVVTDGFKPIHVYRFWGESFGIYTGITALVINLAVFGVLTLVLTRDSKANRAIQAEAANE